MGAAAQKLPRTPSVPSIASLPGHISRLGLVLGSKSLCRRHWRATSIASLSQTQHSADEGEREDIQRHMDEHWSSYLASTLCSEKSWSWNQPHGTALRAGVAGGDWVFLSFLIPPAFNKRETEAGKKRRRGRALLALQHRNGALCRAAGEP